MSRALREGKWSLCNGLGKYPTGHSVGEISVRRTRDYITCVPLCLLV